MKKHLVSERTASQRCDAEGRLSAYLQVDKANQIKKAWGRKHRLAAY